jgi:hypothetical protein
MKSAFKFLNGVAINTYSTKARGGPNCFDHMIASLSIMPFAIRLAELPKLSDHAALVRRVANRGRKLEHRHNPLWSIECSIHSVRNYKKMLESSKST